MTPKEMIKVIQAYRDCKTIQCRTVGSSRESWTRANAPCWDFERFDYREKPFTGYLNIYEDEVWFHETREAASRNAGKRILRCVKVQEVEEDG